MGIAELKRLWRLIGTGISFSAFGIGGLVLAVTWFPLLSLAIRDRRRRKEVAQLTVHYAFRLFLGGMHALGVMDYRIEGAELLAGERRCVIVANHPTLIDFVLIASVLPRCECIVKEALWSNRFLGGAVKAIGYIRNSEGPLLLQRCRDSLGDEGVLVIFPEGTRRNRAEPPRLTRGAAQIAVRNHYDLRLVHVTCDPPTLAKGEKWYHIPPRRPLFTVRVGERICVHNYIASSPTASVAARRLTSDLKVALFPSVIQPLRKAGQS